MPCHSSGSRWAAISVELTRSLNKTVRWRRSPDAALAAPDRSGAPPWRVSVAREAGGASANVPPASADPHSPQYFLPAGLSLPQWEQVMSRASRHPMQQRLGILQVRARDPVANTLLAVRPGHRSKQLAARLPKRNEASMGLDSLQLRDCQ